MIKRTGDAVCDLHHARGDKKHMFLGLASKPRLTILSVWPQNRWLRFCGLVSKSLAWVFGFGPQNLQLRFGDLAHKITAIVSWLGPQNKVGYGLSVVPQNRQEDENGAGHTSGSSGLLHLEVIQARVSQSSLKISGGTT
jgi:hypothetical protein